MKRFLIPVVAGLVAYGCDRNSGQGNLAGPRSGERDVATQRDKALSPVTATSSPPPAAMMELARRDGPLTNSDLQALTPVMVIQESDPEEVKKRKIEKLIALLPQLKAAALFWQNVAAVPESRLAPFRNEILAELRKLKPAPGKPIDKRFRDAYMVANRLHETEVARIALEQLPLVPVYRFPATPPSEDWGSDAERLAHGEQGIVAATVVELGDAAALAQYRQMVKSAEPDAQRTLIWALGRSTELEDFEFLMGLRGTLAKPESEDTLVRALNRITQEMDRAGRHPESIPEHRSKDSETRLKTAAACKARLEAEGLVRELSFYD